MDRTSALVVLGFAQRPSADELKRRYRTLVRDLHPDRGGDPSAFQALHAAYELLRDEVAEGHGAEPAGPVVARGRPSRDEDAESSARRLDDDVIDAAAQRIVDELVEHGRARAVSRAPGAWTNRVAASLAEAGTSTLDLAVGPRRVPGARPAVGTGPGTTVRITLTARGRAARRALTDLDPSRIGGARWMRQRGDAVSVLTTEVRSEDRVTAARRAVAATLRALDVLSWPLAQWRSDLPRN